MLLLRRRGTDCVRASPDLSGDCPSSAKLTWWWSCLHVSHQAQWHSQKDVDDKGEGGGKRGKEGGGFKWTASLQSTCATQQ